MKLANILHRLVILMALPAVLGLCRGAGAEPTPPPLTAASAILVDAASGKILFAKNASERRPMASTTKIMTALVTLEKCRPQEIATVSGSVLKADGSRLGLESGEQITVEALLTALLLKSANDAAVALAEHAGGSVDGFVTLMNQRAAALGARDTHFSNPHGLYAPDHYSSAYDLSLMAREAMRQPLFRRLVSTRIASVPRPDGSTFPVANHNRLLFQDAAVDGVKTGYVRQSGRCLVVSATRGGWRLIAVLLDSQELWQEAETLLDYGFSNWTATVFASKERSPWKARIIGGCSRFVPLVAEEDRIEVRPVGVASDLSSRVSIVRKAAPVRKGQRMGEILLFRRGKEAGSIPLLAERDVAAAGWLIGLRRAAQVLLAAALGLGALKIYGKIAKTARRRGRRFQTTS